MWLKTIEKILSVVAKLAAALFLYDAGKTSVEKDQLESELSDVELRRKAEDEINASHSDPTLRERLRNKWKSKK